MSSDTLVTYITYVTRNAPVEHVERQPGRYREKEKSNLEARNDDLVRRLGVYGLGSRVFG